MASDRQWSISWNEREGQFFARHRTWNGSAWATKRIPRSFRRHQALDAERWMVSWFHEYARTGGMNAAKPAITSAAKTLNLIAPKWLGHRHADPGTKPNTWRGFEQSVRNWILDSSRFDHESIEGLDMEKAFDAEVCLGWIRSLRGQPRTILHHLLVLRTLFNDAIAMGWLDNDLVNPFDRPAIKKEITRLLKTEQREKVVTYLSPQQVNSLLTVQTSRVHDYRRVRYVVALAAGLRDSEVQGLVWSDLHLEAKIPYVLVDRQLDKIGAKPFVQYEDLVKRGLGKTEIEATKQALMSDPKRGSRRALPLHPAAVEALRAWHTKGWRQYVGRKPAKDDPVFPSGKINRHSPPGQFCFVESPQLLRADLRRVGERDDFNGLPLDFHALRRTFATMLSEAGVSEAEVGDLLGHGAASVARANYISPEVLGRRYELVKRLPLPQQVALSCRPRTSQR
jgi:integrase